MADILSKLIFQALKGARVPVMHNPTNLCGGGAESGASAGEVLRDCYQGQNECERNVNSIEEP